MFSAKELFGKSQFDRVFISYALSMIPNWQETIEHSASLLDEGGRLFVVDFGRQEKLPKWFKALLFAWLRKFHVAPREELPSLLNRLADAPHMTANFASLYRGYAMLGSLTRNANDPSPA